MTRPSFRERLAALDATQPDACWIWTAYLNPAGYGMVSVDGRVGYVHRIAYQMLVGPIAPGMQLDHLCRESRCFNPRHLEAVTPRENVHRSRSPAAANARKGHCVNGHAFDEANTRVKRMANGTTERVCRTCAREHMRATRMKRAS